MGHRDIQPGVVKRVHVDRGRLVGVRQRQGNGELLRHGRCFAAALRVRAGKGNGVPAPRVRGPERARPGLCCERPNIWYGSRRKWSDESNEREIFIDRMNVRGRHFNVKDKIVQLLAQRAVNEKEMPTIRMILHS